MTRRVTIRAIAGALIVEAFNRYNLSPAKRDDDFLNAVDYPIEDLAMLPFLVPCNSATCAARCSKASPTTCFTRFESKTASLIW